MHIAIGYYWFTHAAGYHFERAVLDAGHTVTYVGLSAGLRPGYDSVVSITDIVAGLPHKSDLYLWIDRAGRYFPRGIEDIEDLDIPSACYLIDVHLGAWRKRAARFFDAVFVGQKDYRPACREAAGHKRVWWLPLADAPDVHRRHELPRLLARIAHYLANETERARIAEAGYRRVHAEHAYAHRIQTIIQRVADTSFRMIAPVRQADRAKGLAERRAIYTRLHMLDIILDDARAQTRNALRRAIMALPCLARRLL
ncbi:MAG: hypothetical protein KatS3mg052_0555 [Candidatus Roseilinea sp.]|nr:MAG: hypothetical protein KatS3mg052_0555 [Candidatus Roseilinea sp.]